MLQCNKGKRGHTSRPRVEFEPEIQDFTTQNGIRLGLQFFVIILTQRYLDDQVNEAETGHAYIGRTLVYKEKQEKCISK
jgi:hypothetical protein